MVSCCLWLLGLRLWRFSRCVPHGVLGTQPPAVCSCAHLHSYRRCGRLLLKVSFTGGPQAVVPRTQAWASLFQDLGRHLRMAQSSDGSQGPPPESIANETVENSVCLKRPVRHGWMPVHGMSEHRPSVAIMSCAGLGVHSGQCGACFVRRVAQAGLVLRKCDVSDLSKGTSSLWCAMSQSVGSALCIALACVNRRRWNHSG